MRNIRKFVVVTGYGNNPDEIITTSRKIGFEYPMPHYFIVDVKGYPTALKMRPTGSRCATIRDEKIAEEGIGIVVSGTTPAISKDASNLISKIIKSVIDDLGLKQVEIISDELQPDHRVNITDINPWKLESIFSKLK